jgi:hypothetical protein
MLDCEKLGIFREYLELIQNIDIKRFTEFAILKLPEYFWTLPASTTGLFHGSDEMLIDHVIGCLYLSKQVCEHQFKMHWTQRQKSQLYSAIILHDGWRCGEPGNEKRITEKTVKKYNLGDNLLGNLKTSKDHAEIGYKQLLCLVLEFNNKSIEDGSNPIDVHDYSMILEAVRYHYGPFLEIPGKSFSLSWSYDSVVVQCHNIDFHQCHNQIYTTKVKCQ